MIQPWAAVVLANQGVEPGFVDDGLVRVVLNTLRNSEGIFFVVIKGTVAPAQASFGEGDGALL